MSDTPPAVGAIRLLDAARPGLAAGVYRIASTLDVTPVGGGSALTTPLPLQSHVRVEGPRFMLDAGEIASRHPPQSAAGDFSQRLPHVALARRTLPWERALADGTPWLALLVVRDDEGKLTSGKLRASLPAAVIAAMPDLPEKDPAVTLLEMRDLATLKALLPSRADVRLLAHVRQVNLADTDLAGRDDDGSFAIVTANRLPLPVAGAEVTKYVACVVSLEGRDDLWAALSGDPPRLLVLANWSFDVSDAAGTFEALVRKLEDVAPYGAPRLGDAAVLGADGALNIERIGRDGERADARYRGPLLGTHAGQSDGDAEDEISRACAFELGRLLGAADGRFLRELVAWHRAEESAARAALVQDNLAASLAPPPALRAAAASPAQARSGTHQVREGLVQLLARRPRGNADLWRVHPAATALMAKAATGGVCEPDPDSVDPLPPPPQEGP